MDCLRKGDLLRLFFPTVTSGLSAPWVAPEYYITRIPDAMDSGRKYGNGGVRRTPETTGPGSASINWNIGLHQLKEKDFLR